MVRADEKSGRLVRSVVLQPQVVQPRAVISRTFDPAPLTTAVSEATDLVSLVDSIAAEQGVEESLVHSVIRAESNYNPYAVSAKGALGIMQLIPATARRFGVSDLFDPRENIRGGVKYLKFLLDYYQGDYPKAIAAYNAGEAAVDKYQGIPPYPETRNYVYQVARNLKDARQKRAASSSSTALKTANATTSAETRVPPETSVGTDGRIYYRTP